MWSWVAQQLGQVERLTFVEALQASLRSRKGSGLGRRRLASNSFSTADLVPPERIPAAAGA
jgi:hypothetical protein